MLVRMVIQHLGASATLSECHHGTMGWDCTVTFRGVPFRIAYDRGYVDVCEILSDGQAHQLCPAWHLDGEEPVAGPLVEAIRRAAEVHRGPTSR
jgi:hypothetical protein